MNHRYVTEKILFLDWLVLVINEQGAHDVVDDSELLLHSRLLHEFRDGFFLKVFRVVGMIFEKPADHYVTNWRIRDAVASIITRCKTRIRNMRCSGLWPAKSFLLRPNRDTQSGKMHRDLSSPSN